MSVMMTTTTLARKPRGASPRPHVALYHHYFLRLLSRHYFMYQPREASHHNAYTELSSACSVPPPRFARTNVRRRELLTQRCFSAHSSLFATHSTLSSQRDTAARGMPCALVPAHAHVLAPGRTRTGVVRHIVAGRGTLVRISARRPRPGRSPRECSGRHGSPRRTHRHTALHRAGRRARCSTAVHRHTPPARWDLAVEHRNARPSTTPYWVERPMRHRADHWDRGQSTQSSGCIAKNEEQTW